MERPLKRPNLEISCKGRVAEISKIKTCPWKINSYVPAYCEGEVALTLKEIEFARFNYLPYEYFPSISVKNTKKH
jgi:hypothetical protein